MQNQSNENLPATAMDPDTAKELQDPEGVLELDDFTIKMDKDRKKGFLVKYDAEWESVDTLPPLTLTAVELYYAHFDGAEYQKRDLNDPPPKKEAEKWGKHGKLTVYHSQYGQGGFLLAPSGVLALKSYIQKWGRQEIEVIGKAAKIGSRTAKTKKGFVINVPKFLPGWLYEIDALPEPEAETVNHLDHADEPISDADLF